MMFKANRLFFQRLIISQHFLIYLIREILIMQIRYWKWEMILVWGPPFLAIWIVYRINIIKLINFVYRENSDFFSPSYIKTLVKSIDFVYRENSESLKLAFDWGESLLHSFAICNLRFATTLVCIKLYFFTLIYMMNIEHLNSCILKNLERRL